LHLISITSWFISSSFEEVETLDLITLIEDLGDGLFTNEEISKRIIEILEVIDYKVHAPTVFDYSCVILKDLKIETLLNEKEI